MVLSLYLSVMRLSSYYHIFTQFCKPKRVGVRRRGLDDRVKLYLDDLGAHNLIEGAPVGVLYHSSAGYRPKRCLLTVL